MLNEFSRSQLLLGAAAMERLARAKVAVFGLGGVGGHAADALARTGVGSFVLVDGDRVFLGSNKGGVLREHPLQLSDEDLVKIYTESYR